MSAKFRTFPLSYAALGLLANMDSIDPLSSRGSIIPSPSTLEAGEGQPAPKTGRIIRDAEGRVIGAEIPDDEEEANNNNITPWGAPMAGNDDQVAPVSPKSRAAKELEEMAKGGRKKPRRASAPQINWLRELVSVHGEDMDAMVRDRRRNVWQKTAGELRRAIVIAGGIEELRRLGS